MLREYDGDGNCLLHAATLSMSDPGERLSMLYTSLPEASWIESDWACSGQVTCTASRAGFGYTHDTLASGASGAAIPTETSPLAKAY